MDIVIIKTYSAPAVPEWFGQRLERVIPSGILRWNWREDYWELWRRVPGSQRILEGPLTRWCTWAGRRLPLNQAFLDHLQRSARLGDRAAEEFFDEIEEYNQQVSDRMAEDYARDRVNRFVRRRGLDTNCLGGCFVSLAGRGR